MALNMGSVLKSQFSEAITESVFWNALWATVSFAIAGAAAWSVASVFGPWSLLLSALGLALGLAGFKFVKHRELLTLSELFQTFLVVCLLGLCADPQMVIWKVPTSLIEVTTLTQFSVSLFVIIYFCVQCGAIAVRERGLSWFEVIALVSAPYLFGWLLLLASPIPPADLLGLTSMLTLSPFALDLVARSIIIAAFSLTVVFLLGLVVDRRTIVSYSLVLLVLFSAISAALTAQLANIPGLLPISGFSREMTLFLQSAILISAAIVSQAGLWGQTYLITGFLMDALGGKGPTAAHGKAHLRQGMSKGAVYGGVFLSLIMGAERLFLSLWAVIISYPLLMGGILGAVLFPLAKTIVESFDGSSPFIQRLRRSYTDLFNYGRGVIVGVGIAWSMVNDLPNAGPWTRSLIGLLIGAGGFAGVSILRDATSVIKSHRVWLQHARVYAVEAALGGVVGAAIGWYLEHSQLQVIYDKFLRYATYVDLSPQRHVIYPLFSKWGALDLGNISGGARLLFNESVSGVIGWSLAAPLFSVNLVLLTALLRRELKPLREFITASGFAKVLSEALRVERWGLWMAPIIYSFLRMSGEPTWYNQDGAIRTVIATVMSIGSDAGEFRTWSLWVFTCMLAFDWLRVIIWFDHMGLRVATLVNLSFIGGDILDEKAARAMGHAGATRCIPEGLRRFATWMPLLIPFYIPRGGDWDYAWNTAEKTALAHVGIAIPPVTWLCGFFVITGAIISFFSLRKGTTYHSLYTSWSGRVYRLYNPRYELFLDAEGRGWSKATRQSDAREEIDLTRRCESSLSLSGKSFFFVERDGDGNVADVWSLHSSPSPAPKANYQCSRVRHNSMHYLCEYKDIRAEATVVVPKVDTFERWDVKVSNRGSAVKVIELLSFRDLVLRPGGAYERHPNFNDLHVATCFVPALHALVACNRLLLGSNRRPSKEMYFHALGVLPKGVDFMGYEDSRGAIIGSGTKRSPLGLRDDFRTMDDEGVLYPFDPGASLRIRLTIPPRSTVKVAFGEGWAHDAEQVANMISRHLKLKPLSADLITNALGKHRVQKRHYHSALSGKDGNELPWKFSADGKVIHVRENTPRPWSHPIANPDGYGLIANNEGAVFSFCGNAQQNAITPSVLGHQSGTVPGQAWHIWDVDSNRPLVRLPKRLERVIGPNADGGLASKELRSEFGRGYVSYQLESGTLEMQMKLFVLPDKPLEVRMIKLRNQGNVPLKLRITSCIQFALAEIAADTRGGLKVYWNSEIGAFVAENPGQQFRRGHVFVAPFFSLEKTETVYSRYVGRGRGVERPIMAECGLTDEECPDNGYRVAACSGLVFIDRGGEVELALVIGQADQISDIDNWLTELRGTGVLEKQLERTKEWWNDFLNVLRIETEDPAFDRLINDWIPYQLVTARLWGRTGPQQRSGAYGFRDQLQDVIPLACIHPELARSQILLHSAQQFLEGDTLQWWHRTWDGRTGLGARNHASDAMLWLPYVVEKYLKATKDNAILDEQVPFLEGREIPEGTEGICFVPRTSRESATVYGHCKKSIEHVLSKLGENGIPLMGSGDWNDGLDAIGRHGKGESTWLGFFLYGVLVDFAQIVKEKEGEEAAHLYVQASRELREALKKTWRNGQFLRATNDLGEELIYDDALTSSWPVIARAVDQAIGEQAMLHGISALEKDKIVLLLSPSFDESSRPYPGRIANYPPGVRENGGQYSHGASWLVDAALCLAEGAEAEGDLERAQKWREHAGRLWHKISPLTHAANDNWQIYGAEPHQQPADVYYGPGYEGRGGWSWYTGSAGRMLTAAWALVGIEIRSGELIIADWAHQSTTWPKLKKVTYRERDYSVKKS